MVIGAVMRGAQDGQLFFGQVESLHAAGFNERQRLEGLSGRAQVSDQAGIAIMMTQLAAGIHDGNGAKMHAFKHVSTPDVQNRLAGLLG